MYTFRLLQRLKPGLSPPGSTSKAAGFYTPVKQPVSITNQTKFLFQIVCQARLIKGATDIHANANDSSDFIMTLLGLVGLRSLTVTSDVAKQEDDMVSNNEVALS